MKPSWLPLAELSSSPQKKKKPEEKWIFAQPTPQAIQNDASAKIETGTDGSTSGKLSFSPQLCKAKIRMDQRR
ncbi:hypothetical protein ATANTOWER_019515 [Ataeniobius toweri]|uniref:Uncharacterized protein n=1 Tax=Ataeniobius toweri TaxID=208326 RepID=A0ABU7CHJ8_9TELE|nr:hypothetical protein [Ataeniobius toweri]